MVVTSVILYVFYVGLFVFFFFFFKQKTAYEMRISDWSSDVCSSDLCTFVGVAKALKRANPGTVCAAVEPLNARPLAGEPVLDARHKLQGIGYGTVPPHWDPSRSEEHTSELQSLMRISYAVFCLKKKTHHTVLPSTILSDHHIYLKT